MHISKISTNLLIISIYIITIFCGVGTLYSNNLIDNIRLVFQFALPFVVCLSIIYDQKKDLKILKKYKFCLILILLNIIWFILSILFGINIGIQSVKGLVTFINILLFIFLIAKIQFNDEDTKRIKKAIYISALICAIYGIIQYVFKINLNVFENAKYPGINGRINSTFYIATLFDKYMILIFLLSCFNLFKNNNWFFKILFFLTGTNVILTFTRSGLIALGIVIFVFVLISFIQKKYNNIILTVLFLVIIFLIPGVNHLFQVTAQYGYNILNMPESLRINFVSTDNESDKNETTTDLSINFRDYYNKIGFEFIKENPILGIGLNNYSYLYNNQNAKEFLKNDSVLEKDLEYMYPHNGYIQLASEIGIVGLALFFTYLFYISISFLKNNTNKFKLLSILILFIFMLGSYTESLIYNKQYAFMFLLLFSLFSNKSFYETKKMLKLKPKKITFLMLHLGYGGIETSTINTANALSKKYNVELISFYDLNNNQCNKINKNVNVKFLYNGGPNKEELLTAIKNKNIYLIFKEGIKSIDILVKRSLLMIKEIKKSKSDVLISTRVEFTPLLSKYGSNKKLKIAQEHYHHNNNKRYINKIKYKYDNIDYLCALTNTLKNDYEKFLVNNTTTKVVLMPNMIKSNFKKFTNLKNNNIIFIGRLHELKRVNELVKIFSKIKKEDYMFYIIGDGEEYSNIANLISDLDLDNNVKMLGYLNQKEIEKYLLKSKVFCMASITEGLPMVLLEAMSYGVPCIAYNTESGVKDIIDDGENGFIIYNRNEEEYIEKLNKIMLDNNLLSNMSKNAIKKAKSFEEKEILKKWEQILNQKI